MAPRTDVLAKTIEQTLLDEHAAQRRNLLAGSSAPARA
jgi:hypothetical protein